MRRTVALFVAVFMLLSGPFAFARVSAQQATPAAGAAGIGEPVPIVGTEGTEVAQITIDELTDPFDEYDPGSPPKRGFHFVALEITVWNSGDRVFEVNPGAFYLVDSDGFVTAQGGLYRGNEPTPPDLVYQADLAPGAEATGVVAFQVLSGTAPSAIVYIPRSDRLVVLADLAETAPAVGDSIPVIATEGGEAGQVTVTDLTDPFEEYDPGASPQRGSHFVLIEATIENTGARPLAVDPGTFYLVDTDGFIYGRAGISRGQEPTPPDFVYNAELAPGAEATGAIGYQVLNGVEIARVIYVPASDRLITVAVTDAG